MVWNKSVINEYSKIFVVSFARFSVIFSAFEYIFESTVKIILIKTIYEDILL